MPFSVRYLVSTETRVEGTPFYDVAEYTLPLVDACDQVTNVFKFRVRAFRELPLCDAVGLLSGDDQTGLIVWTGALAMIEWFVCDCPSRAATLLAPHAEESVLCLELGCGCGVLTVALAQYLSSCVRTGHVQLLCTDGNEACVALARTNVETMYSDGGGLVECAADALHWGLEPTCCAYRDCLERHGVRPGEWTGRLVFLSADVIYDAEAIPLLVSTVHTLLILLQSAARDTDSSGGGCPATWWLLYAPRSLTRAKNIALFGQLTSALCTQPGWIVTRHRLPPQSLTTGFEATLPVGQTGATREDAEMEADALLGCLVEVQLRHEGL